jgi:hypothetical protein
LPRDPDDEDVVHDCRHGRVILNSYNDDKGYEEFVVWDPMTGSQRLLLSPEPYHNGLGYGAAVLCAVDGCDHRDCHMGPFLVVYMCVDNDVALV